MLPTRILIVDDEENFRRSLSVILEQNGYSAGTAEDGIAALEQLKEDEYQIVIADVRMPRMDGLALLDEIQRNHPDLLVIVMSAYGTMELAIDAMKKGAYDFISKPFKSDEIMLTLRKAEEREALRRENVRLRREVERTYSFKNIVAKSRSMLAIFETIRKVADYKSTVLITGESGTGKELIARAIHFNSNRRTKPFVAVNCAAIPENLLESELFGHMKGAFTDAVANKKGLFEEADGGSLFLDEIGELSMSLQVKLLRAIQDENIRRVGDTQEIQVDVRIIIATLKDLVKEVKAGRFREDLYYRLNVMEIVVPPLRRRKEDILHLVNRFVRRHAEALSKTVRNVSPEVTRLLLEYSWPGNVRELENTIERAVVLADCPVLGVEHLPPTVRERPSAPLLEPAEDELSIKKATRSLEARLIAKALRETRGNRTQAARLLEISHRALLYKLKQYQIHE